MQSFLWETNLGLAARIAVGVLALAVLAGVDIWRNGRGARRWREYLFLLAATSFAMIYGIANDQLTVTISPEYFLYGKGMVRVLGEAPSGPALRVEAFKLGMMATWWVGLIGGALMLLANSLPKRLPRVGDGRLYRMLALPFICAAGLAVACGLLQWIGVTRGWWITDFEPLIGYEQANARFALVWGMHLGGYFGAGIGAVIAAGRIVQLRRRISV